MKFYIDILGTDYQIEVGEKKSLKLSTDDCGVCRNYSKKIRVATDDCSENLEKGEQREIVKEVVTHELTHAFLYESGKVSESSDETLVEWLSVMIPKLVKAVTEVMKAIDKEEILND